MACLVGVRRETATRAATNLQLAGLFDCSRGRVHVFERSAPEARPCEPYAVVKDESKQRLPQRLPLDEFEATGVDLSRVAALKNSRAFATVR